MKIFGRCSLCKRRSFVLLESSNFGYGHYRCIRKKIDEEYYDSVFKLVKELLPLLRDMNKVQAEIVQLQKTRLLEEMKTLPKLN